MERSHHAPVDKKPPHYKLKRFLHRVNENISLAIDHAAGPERQGLSREILFEATQRLGSEPAPDSVRNGYRTCSDLAISWSEAVEMAVTFGHPLQKSGQDTDVMRALSVNMGSPMQWSETRIRRTLIQNTRVKPTPICSAHRIPFLMAMPEVVQDDNHPRKELQNGLNQSGESDDCPE